MLCFLFLQSFKVYPVTKNSIKNTEKPSSMKLVMTLSLFGKIRRITREKGYQLGDRSTDIGNCHAPGESNLYHKVVTGSLIVIILL